MESFCAAVTGTSLLCPRSRAYASLPANLQIIGSLYMSGINDYNFVGYSKRGHIGPLTYLVRDSHNYKTSSLVWPLILGSPQCNYRLLTMHYSCVPPRIFCWMIAATTFPRSYRRACRKECICVLAHLRRTGLHRPFHHQRQTLSTDISPCHTARLHGHGRWLSKQKTPGHVKNIRGRGNATR
jgi:hypothetical protein